MTILPSPFAPTDPLVYEAKARLTGSTPIVGSFIGEDPIAAGFAKSLVRRGGNVAGIAILAPELDAKPLDLLHHVVPGARRIAALAVDTQRDAPNIAAMCRVAGRTGLAILPVCAAAPADDFAAIRNTEPNSLEIVSSPELSREARTLERSQSRRNSRRFAMAIDGNGRMPGRLRTGFR